MNSLRHITRYSSVSALLAGLFFLSLLTGCKQKSARFSVVPASSSNIDFANNLEKRDRLNILYYLYYYNGGGVAIGDINKDDLPDIYFTANKKGGNRLYLNKGDLQFEDITESAGVAGNADWHSGVTMADVNGDGLLDIYVCAVAGSFQLTGKNQLYINKGNNQFQESAAAYGLDFSGLSTQAAFFDFDRDGDLDCYLLNHSKQPHSNIIDTSNRRKPDPLAGDRLYRNDLSEGKHTFTDVSASAGIYQSKLGYGLGLAISDFNNDGWPDIYVGNDFHENDYYYLNNQQGGFTEAGAEHFRHYSRFSMGNDAADLNNDGQVDLVTVDMLPPDEKTLKTYGSDENPDIYKLKLERNGYQHQYSRNVLQINNGDGKSFSDQALQAGVFATDWSWSPLLADFNGDGNKDLFISSGILKRPVDLDYVRFVSSMERNQNLSGTDAYDDEVIKAMPDGATHPFFFSNTGSGLFQEVSKSWGTSDLKGYYTGAAYADLDNDGDLDIIINAINEKAVLLKNNQQPKQYLRFKTRGEGLNSTGLGARLYAFHSGKLQLHEIMPTRGFQSASDTRWIIGLDSIGKIDSLLVVWSDQQFQLLKDFSPNKTIELDQLNASGKFDYTRFFYATANQFSSATVSIPFQHRENAFVDHNVQYLIPHGLSTRGPKMAVADINGDGLDDAYITGAAGQPGALLLQTATGGFESKQTDLFQPFSAQEEVDAIFFDANTDGQPDLYIAIGGNELDDNNPGLQDRLYINQGKGVFKLDTTALPPIRFNKGAVAVADIDKDGDQDLFVGVLANARQYGVPHHSYLLLNDGKGKFFIADKSIFDGENIGMVTTASFADLNQDGFPELVIAGEWMPVVIAKNNSGKFTREPIAGSTGLWQSVFLTDTNGDGQTDILAGNWGHNSKLYAGKNGPLKLYIKDFDKNGTIEQVMAYTIDGKEYPFLAKDELERALPVLKKAYLTYGEVAGKTVDFILYDLFKDYIEQKAEVLGNSVFISDGKGGFTRTDLPASLQLAPIFAFAPLDGSEKNYIAAGNFYNVTPYEGRYDAQNPVVFGIDGNVRPITHLPGEVRDLKWLRSPGNKKRLVVVRNNQSPLVFDFSN